MATGFFNDACENEEPFTKKKKNSVFLNRWKEDRSGPLSAIITLVLLLNVISLFSCKP